MVDLIDYCDRIRDFICHPLDVLPLPPTAVETKPSSRVKGVPESGLVPIDAQMNVDSVNPSPLSRNNPTILVSDTSTTKANALGDNPTSGIFRSVSNASTASVTGALANIKINRSLGKIGEGASTTNGSAAVETSRCDCTRTNVNRDCICQTGQMDVDDQNATTNGDLLKELPMANVDMDVDDKKPESTTPKLSVQVDRIPFPTIPRRAPSTDHESSQLSSSLKPTDWKWTSGAAVDWGAGERDSSTDSPLSPSYPPSRSFTPPSAGSMASMELSYPPLPSLSQTQSPDPGQSTSITDSQPQSQSQTQSQTQTQPPSNPSTSTPTAPIPMGLGLNFDLNTNPYSSMVALSSMQPSITAGNTHVVPYGYPAYPAPASAFANASYLPVAPTPPFANASFPGYPYTYPYGYPTPPPGAQQLSYAVSLSYPPPGGVMTIPTAPDPTSRVSPAEDVDMADSQPQDPSSVVDSKAADTGASMVVDSGQQEPATEPLQAKANGAKSKGKSKGKATKAALAAADVVDSGGSSSSSSQQPQKKKARPSKSLATALNAAFASTSSNPSSPFTIAPLPNSAPVSSPLDLNSPFTIAPLSNGTASASSPLDPSASTSTAGTTKAKVKTTKKATGKAATAGSTAKSRKSSKTSTPTTTTPLQNASNLSGEPEEKVQYHPQPLPVPPDYKALRQPGVPFVLPPEIQVLVESYVDGLPIIVVCERKSLSGVWSGGSGVGAGVGGSGGRKGKGKAEKETDKVREKEGESKGELEVLGKIPLREECAYVWMGYFRVTKVWVGSSFPRSIRGLFE
ncbi:hypothetical protein BDN72DRAFT_375625 [Pluteus cervinus]|uniref:Uncharacterized protein n=1 Tax=Pluteus cervinus TaxID=181527 RepID=A0ACD3AAP8_9AGAR|nr:hypothetical protein BDN72DRAFT_375625 [Pluteus cervinus]